MKIIIVGAGEVGFHIASRLARENKDVVVIDNDPETLRRVAENMDVQVLRGSGGSPRFLKKRVSRKRKFSWRSPTVMKPILWHV